MNIKGFSAPHVVLLFAKETYVAMLSVFIFFFLCRYVVCSGVVDDIRTFFSAIHGPLNDDPASVDYAQACLALLSGTAQYLGSR